MTKIGHLQSKKLCFLAMWRVLFFLILLLPGVRSFGQEKEWKRVDQAIKVSGDEVVYGLPKTVVTVTMNVKRTQYHKPTDPEMFEILKGHTLRSDIEPFGDSVVYEIGSCNLKVKDTFGTSKKYQLEVKSKSGRPIASMQSLLINPNTPETNQANPDIRPVNPSDRYSYLMDFSFLEDTVNNHQLPAIAVALKSKIVNIQQTITSARKVHEIGLDQERAELMISQAYATLEPLLGIVFGRKEVLETVLEFDLSIDEMTLEPISLLSFNKRYGFNIDKDLLRVNYFRTYNQEFLTDHYGKKLEVVLEPIENSALSSFELSVSKVKSKDSHPYSIPKLVLVTLVQGDEHLVRRIVPFSQFGHVVYVPNDSQSWAEFMSSIEGENWDANMTPGQQTTLDSIKK